MTAPHTRFDEATTDFERELLSSWGTEAPSREARDRVLALASGASVIGAATATHAAGLGGSALLTAAAPRAATLGLFGIAKWFAVTVVVGTSVGVVAALVRSEPKAATQAASVAARATARPARVPATSTVAFEGSPGVHPREESVAPAPPAASVAEAPAPAVTPRTGAPARAHIATDRPPSAAHTAAAKSAVLMPPVAEARAPLALGDQAALVDRARAALALGDAATAARLADEYDARFPSGVLAQEATVVRIQALVMRGDVVSARALGERFLAANGASPHAARVRRLLGIAPNP